MTVKEARMSKTLKDLMEYFNKRPRIGTLGTASKEGKPNVAHLGSPQMVDEKTVVMGLGQNRTLANLQENPYAVFTILEPAKTVTEWKGVRVYLKMTDLQTSGEKLDRLKDAIAKNSGEGAAKMVKAVATFQITEIRPIVDFGQGWENTI
jgi:predicted pyridoxine 5'-phosphate oxidase superfamily flavin-nucleotide-binding protein